MPKVTVLYFAQLRDRRGRSEESLDTAATTARALYDGLAATHGFRATTDHVRVAVNEAVVAWDTALNDGDTVVFLPPVSGG